MKRYRKRDGFTLVEVLIALAILGIGIVGVTVLFPAALHDIQRASGATVSAILAESVIDDIRARGYTGIAAELASHPFRSTITDTIGGLQQADAVYHLYSGATVWAVDRWVVAEDLYATIQVEVPLPDGRVERYVTYIARQ